MIVLDTNVVSELMRPNPDPRVVAWVDRQPAEQLRLTAMTVAELLAGVAQLPTGVRKQQLGDRLQQMLTELFDVRVLPFDMAAAVSYAVVVTTRRAAGRPIGTADATIAATCLAAGATGLATRNTGDFTGVGLTLVDPWTAERP